MLLNWQVGEERLLVYRDQTIQVRIEEVKTPAVPSRGIHSQEFTAKSTTDDRKFWIAHNGYALHVRELKKVTMRAQEILPNGKPGKMMELDRYE